ncbi:MAG: transcriptional regulator [Planctomycetaceae bacterium]|nr:transcriptional regulator [Planctomycetaceae bacterium]MDP7277361.1 Rrf2 family transcriptional regulator [Planctomycetaceae bacterium]
MFSRTVEYALRAIVQLAHVAPDVATTEQISAATQVPEPYLRKVLQALGRAELVTSQRGASGGVRLARGVEDLTILDVVNAVDPIERISRCPLDLKSHGDQLCPLHARIDHALSGIEEAFRNTTLAEVLSEPTGSTPLCDFSKE